MRGLREFGRQMGPRRGRRECDPFGREPSSVGTKISRSRASERVVRDAERRVGVHPARFGLVAVRAACGPVGGRGRDFPSVSGSATNPRPIFRDEFVGRAETRRTKRRRARPPLARACRRSPLPAERPLASTTTPRKVGANAGPRAVPESAEPSGRNDRAPMSRFERRRCLEPRASARGRTPRGPRPEPIRKTPQRDWAR